MPRMREAWVRVPPKVQLFFFGKKAVLGFVLCFAALYSFFLSVLSIHVHVHVHVYIHFLASMQANISVGSAE